LNRSPTRLNPRRPLRWNRRPLCRSPAPHERRARGQSAPSPPRLNCSLSVGVAPNQPNCFVPPGPGRYIRGLLRRSKAARPCRHERSAAAQPRPAVLAVESFPDATEPPPPAPAESPSPGALPGPARKTCAGPVRSVAPATGPPPPRWSRSKPAQLFRPSRSREIYSGPASALKSRSAPPRPAVLPVDSFPGGENPRRPLRWNRSTPELRRSVRGPAPFHKQERSLSPPPTVCVTLSAGAVWRGATPHWRVVRTPLRGSGNLTSLKGWPSASSSWRAQKVGKPAEGTYIFVPGDEFTIHSRAQPCVQGTAHFAVAPRAWARSPTYCRGGKHRHRPACLSFRTSLLEVTKNPCSTVATASAAPLRRRAGRTSARTAPLAALQANRPPSPHGQPQTPWLSAGGLWGAAWWWPPTPPTGHHRKPRGLRRGAEMVFFFVLNCPLPSFPTQIPAAASNRPSRRQINPSILLTFAAGFPTTLGSRWTALLSIGSIKRCGARE
jgi:hypothetical protein